MSDVQGEAPSPGLFGRLRNILAMSAGAALLNASAMVIVLGFGVVVWELMEPMPIRSVRVVRVEPADRIVDRSRDAYLSIWRNVCARKAVSARLTRSWVDDGGGVLNTLDDWVLLQEGCHDRPPVRVYPPSSLAEGATRYRVTLTYCNTLKCRDYHLEDLEITVLGHRPIYNRPPEANRF